MSSRALPKIGAVLDLYGRRAVVISECGTVNRGTMPVRRGVDIVSMHVGGTLTGVHAQYLDTGSLVTIDRASLAHVAVIS